MSIITASNTIFNIDRDSFIDPTVVTITDTAETTILAAGGQGKYNDVFAILITNTSSTPVRVDIRDKTGGTIRFPIFVPAEDTRGISLGAIIPQTDHNENWTAQVLASVTDIRITVFAIKNN